MRGFSRAIANAIFPPDPPRVTQLSRSQKRSLMKALIRGQRVSDPTLVAYVNPLARWYEWVIRLCLFVAVVSVVSGSVLTTPTAPYLVALLATIPVLLIWLRQTRRCRMLNR